MNLSICENFEDTLNTGNDNWNLEFGVRLATEIDFIVDLLDYYTHKKLIKPILP